MYQNTPDQLFCLHFSYRRPLAHIPGATHIHVGTDPEVIGLFSNLSHIRRMVNCLHLAKFIIKKPDSLQLERIGILLKSYKANNLLTISWRTAELYVPS